MNLIVADTLEDTLLPMNDHPALRQSPKLHAAQPEKGAECELTEKQIKKNERERVKRDDERFHLERLTFLFKVAAPGNNWTRVEVLSFGTGILVDGFKRSLTGFVAAAVYILCGPKAFPPGFICPLPGWALSVLFRGWL